MILTDNETYTSGRYNTYFKLRGGIFLSGIDKDTGAIIGTRSENDILWFTPEEALYVERILDESTVTYYEKIMGVDLVMPYLEAYCSGLISIESLIKHYKINVAAEL